MGGLDFAAGAAGAGDVVRRTECCDEKFEHDANVENPEEVADEGEQEHQQTLRLRNLESVKYTPNRDDQTHKKMQ
jgi:hypothetical protein